MKKIKLLFQGDSITDCWRNYSDPHNLGKGYAKLAAENLKEKFKDIDFEFINLGLSESETKDLLSRLDKEVIDVKPDIVSILIGINDVWHYVKEKNWITDEQFENNYRKILRGIKENTNAKIMILEPFSFPLEEKLILREDLPRKIDIIRKLAREYADAYVPLDGLFASVFVTEDPRPFTEDGLHPSDKGAKFIAQKYMEYISTLL